VPAIQICTGSACHLDAHLVHTALHELNLADVDVLFIENVGNLVCPASFDLGQHRNVTLLSTPEGDDKPAKYPVMFRAADIVLLTKSDLIEVLGDFETATASSYIRELANPAPILELSARNGSGVAAWCDWILDEIDSHRQQIAHEKTIPTQPGDKSNAHSHAVGGH
jgi:hydrogenase nickel incorporation protein HypB